MKLIDEKGKLFGKFNVIDFLAVIVLVAALLFVGYRFLRSATAGDNEPTSKLIYTVRVNGIDQQTYNEAVRHMEANGGKDQLMASGDMVDAYVTRIDAIPHENYAFDAQGQLVYSQETFEGHRLDLIFTIEADITDSTTNLVGTQEVRVGKGHIIKTTHFEFTYGSVVTCQWE